MKKLISIILLVLFTFIYSSVLFIPQQIIAVTSDTIMHTRKTNEYLNENEVKSNDVFTTYSTNEQYLDSGSVMATNSTLADGWLDSVTSTHISGWAWQSDIPNTPIQIHIYLQNLTTQQQVVYFATAGDYRSDLASAGYGNGYHGFNYSIDWSRLPYGVYTVNVYAISTNGINPLLQGCPRNYQSATTIGQKGYAVYRDLGTLPSIFAPGDWHAGILCEEYVTDNLSIVHKPGIFGDIGAVSFEDFVGDLTYRGIYRPTSNFLCGYDRERFVSMARYLATRDIGYITTYQLQATVWPDAEKIEPDDIASIRCDGLIEYCYEYYGYRVYGNDALWDISKASTENLQHHSTQNILPKAQATNYLRFSNTIYND